MQCRDNNTCIERSKVGDGNEDCADGSDEGIGARLAFKSICSLTDANGDSHEGFKCDNGKCISIIDVCNFKNDCSDERGLDNTDERGGICPCGEDKFMVGLFYIHSPQAKKILSV